MHSINISDRPADMAGLDIGKTVFIVADECVNPRVRAHSGRDGDVRSKESISGKSSKGRNRKVVATDIPKKVSRAHAMEFEKIDVVPVATKNDNAKTVAGSK